MRGNTDVDKACSERVSAGLADGCSQHCSMSVTCSINMPREQALILYI